MLKRACTQIEQLIFVSHIINQKKSKPIIDQIDTVKDQHYGFTEEELDFIINYDIKYRMGEALFGEKMKRMRNKNIYYDKKKRE